MSCLFSADLPESHQNDRERGENYWNKVHAPIISNQFLPCPPHHTPSLQGRVGDDQVKMLSKCLLIVPTVQGK